MYYAGIDYHKRYSVVSIRDGQGQIVQEQRVDHQCPEGFKRLFRECRGPGRYQVHFLERIHVPPSAALRAVEAEFTVPGPDWDSAGEAVSDGKGVGRQGRNRG